MAGQSVIQLLRALEARRSAERTYALAHDKFADLEQRHTGKNAAEAEGAHQYALIALRAYRAEIADPQPSGIVPNEDASREGGRP